MSMPSTATPQLPCELCGRGIRIGMSQCLKVNQVGDVLLIDHATDFGGITILKQDLTTATNAMIDVVFEQAGQ